MNLYATSPTRQIETSTPGPAAGGRATEREGARKREGGGAGSRAQEVGFRVPGVAFGTCALGR